MQERNQFTRSTAPKSEQTGADAGSDLDVYKQLMADRDLNYESYYRAAEIN